MEEYLPQLSEAARRWVRFALLIAAVFALSWLIGELGPVLTPIAFSLALAYILNPVITWLQQRFGIRRVVSISVGLALVITLLVLIGIVVFVQLAQLNARLPVYVDRTASLLQEQQWIDTRISELLGTPTDPLVAGEPSSAPEDAGSAANEATAAQPATTQPATTTTQPAAAGAASNESDPTPAPPGGVGPRITVDQVAGLLGRHANQAGPLVATILAAFSSLGYWLSLTILVPLYTFFFLWRFNEIVAAVRRHLPADYRDVTVRIVGTIDRAMAEFFRGRVVISLLVGVLTGVGWMWAGVPYGFLLGMLAGILNLVPFISILVLPPALIMRYLAAQAADEPWVMGVLFVVAVFLFVQALESFVFTPIVHGQSTGLHAITTVVALLIGAEMAGLLGMLLAIPVASTIKSLAMEYLMPEIRRLAGLPPDGDEAAAPQPTPAAADGPAGAAAASGPEPAPNNAKQPPKPAPNPDHRSDTGKKDQRK